MAAFGLISACYTNIAISVVFAREGGILKRLRGTPLPARSYLTARVLHATFVGFLLVAITVVFGRIAYQAHIPGDDRRAALHPHAARRVPGASRRSGSR